MMQDEADRIAVHMARTIPPSIASLVAVNCRDPYNEKAWGIRCRDTRASSGGLDMQVWIETVQDWVRMQRLWHIRMQQQRQS